jgi:uncharacterized protein
MPPVAALCVYCREKPTDPAWRPFCSERCKLLDLARWIDGDYRVAGDPVDSSTTSDTGATDELTDLDARDPDHHR